MSEPRRRGRPSKLNDERVGTILEALRAGCYLETAAAYAGVHRDTVNRWRQEHPEFADQVERARAEGEVRGLLVINRAEQAGDWRAAAWRLQHAYPERWTQRLQVGGELRLGLSELFEELERRAAAEASDEPDPGSDQTLESGHGGAPDPDRAGAGEG